MKILITVVAIATTGCFVMPAAQQTSRIVGTERSDTQRGASRGLALAVRGEAGFVEVQAVRERECVREVFEISEITTRRSLRMGGADDPRARVFGALLAPVTLPVSLLVSGISVAADRTSTRRVRRPTGVERLACSHGASHAEVRVTLASGDVLVLHGDADGMARFRLPDSEPTRGTLTVTAENATKELRYHRREPVVAAVRDAVTSCAGARGAAGALGVRIAVNASGMPTRVELDREDTELTTCITKQIASLRFPDGHRQTTLVLPFQL